MADFFQNLPSFLEKIERTFQDKLLPLNNEQQLYEFSLEFFGKKGVFSELYQKLREIPEEQRPSVGKIIHEVRQRLEQQLKEKKQECFNAEVQNRLLKERIDVTAPSIKAWIGKKHLITQTIDHVIKILTPLGFSVVTGPEVETEYLNFEAVNISQDHPARDMQDTFFIGPQVVLRTHTSAMQIRALKEKGIPIRILSPGAVYRSDHDATHTPMFHQIEGLWVDGNASLAHLKGVLEYLIFNLFEKDCQIRFRSSFFPFVEPGVEVDIRCFACTHSQSFCSLCKSTKWIEVLGAGMVHPKLFEHAGIKKHCQGFAFGLGVERLAMLLSRVPDLRLFYSNHYKFLKQF